MQSLFSGEKLRSVPQQPQASDFLRRSPQYPVPEAQEEEAVAESEMASEGEPEASSEEEFSIMERIPKPPVEQQSESAEPLRMQDEEKSEDDFPVVSQSESAQGSGLQQEEKSEDEGPLESKSHDGEARAPILDEDRFRAGARRAGAVDMTAAEWEKYSQLRGGDLLTDDSKARLQSGNKRRYYRPERFEGPMEDPLDSTVVGTGELHAHVRNRSRAFRPEGGGRSLFESQLAAARKARARLQRPRVDGDAWAEERDETERSQAESENWLGSDRADKGALVPGFRAKGTAERPYLTELIPQQIKYQRSDRDQALPVGPMKELQAQEEANRVLGDRRDHQDRSLQRSFNTDRNALEEAVNAAQVAHAEATNRTLGVKKWNPLSWIAGIGRAWTRSRDRKRTGGELTAAQRALQDRIAQFQGAEADLVNQRQGENEQIRQQGEPLLARRQELAQPGVPREPDPKFALDPSEVKAKAPARDATDAIGVAQDVVDPFLRDVRREHLKAKVNRMDQRNEGLPVPNYVESLLAQPEPDQDPFFMGITESKAKGEGSYQAMVKAHAQRRMLPDIFKENQIQPFDSVKQGRSKLREVVGQTQSGFEELGRRADRRGEPQNPDEEQSFAKLEAFEDRLMGKMTAYQSDRADAFTPIFKADQKKKAEERAYREWQERQLELDRQQEEADRRREAENERKRKMKLVGPWEQDAGEQDAGEQDAYEEPDEPKKFYSGPGTETKRIGEAGLLDVPSAEVKNTMEDLAQKNRVLEKIEAPIVSNHFGAYSKEDREREERQKAFEEGQSAVQGGATPMQNILNPIVEAGVQHQYNAGMRYVHQNYDEADQEEEKVKYVAPGPNERNVQNNYIAQDYFRPNQLWDNLAGRGRQDAGARDPERYGEYQGYRDLFKAHEKSKKDRKAWEGQRGGKIEKYLLGADDPLKQMKVPDERGRNIKHGYRFIPFPEKKEGKKEGKKKSWW